MPKCTECDDFGRVPRVCWRRTDDDDVCEFFKQKKEGVKMGWREMMGVASEISDCIIAINKNGKGLFMKWVGEGDRPSDIQERIDGEKFDLSAGIYHLTIDDDFYWRVKDRLFSLPENKFCCDCLYSLKYRNEYFCPQVVAQKNIENELLLKRVLENDTCVYFNRRE